MELEGGRSPTELVGRNDEAQPEERSPGSMEGQRPAKVEPEGRGSPVELVDRWVTVEARELGAEADHGARAAMAEQGARVAMAERGAWEASMAGSPPPQIFLRKFFISGGRSGGADAGGRSGGADVRGSGEPDGTSRCSGEPDGTSRGTGEPDGTSRGTGEPDGTSRGSGEPDRTGRGTGEPDGTSRGTGEPDGTSRGSGEPDRTGRGSGELDGASRGSGELDGTGRGSGEFWRGAGMGGHWRGAGTGGRRQEAGTGESEAPSGLDGTSGDDGERRGGISYSSSVSQSFKSPSMSSSPRCTISSTSAAVQGAELHSALTPSTTGSLVVVIVAGSCTSRRPDSWWC